MDFRGGKLEAKKAVRLVEFRNLVSWLKCHFVDMARNSKYLNLSDLSSLASGTWRDETFINSIYLKNVSTKMAWRLTQYLIEGKLDNTKHGKVIGWMKFAGLNEKVIFELSGDFEGGLKGHTIHFSGSGRNSKAAREYMKNFSIRQTGHVEEISLNSGFPGYGAPYMEWCGDKDGRVVIELDPKKFFNEVNSP